MCDAFEAAGKAQGWLPAGRCRVLRGLLASSPSGCLTMAAAFGSDTDRQRDAIYWPLPWTSASGLCWRRHDATSARSQYETSSWSRLAYPWTTCTRRHGHAGEH